MNRAGHFLFDMLVLVMAGLYLCSADPVLADCNSNGLPDECDIACGEPGGACDLPGCGQSSDCNTNGIPDECELEGNDCNANGIPDECDPDCTGNGVPDDCEPDCNNNAIPDDCEIAGGTGVDCNDNGIPDECETRMLAVNDHFADGVLDPAWSIAFENAINWVSTESRTWLAVTGISPNQTDAWAYVTLTQPLVADGDFHVWFDFSWVSELASAMQHASVAVLGGGGSAIARGGYNDVWASANGQKIAYIGESSWASGCNTLPADGIAIVEIERVDGVVTVKWGGSVILSGESTATATALEMQFGYYPYSGGSSFGTILADQVWIRIPGGDEWDCNENGILDECDITQGTSPDCNDNGIADECDLADNDCNSNGIPDKCDISGGTSPDCNGNGVPDELDLTGNDCNDNGVPDTCDLSAGTSPDCNGNNNPDECDLEGNDCNSNGVPDSCDLEGGTSPDCNNNEVPDECDVVGGTSADADGDVIPDECELPLSITGHWPGGVLSYPLRYVDITFSNPIDQAGFSAEDVLLTVPGGGSVAVEQPEDMGDNVWRINFPAVSSNGVYYVYVGPHIHNTYWNELDQDGDGVRGEDPDDIYEWSFEIDAVVNSRTFASDTQIGCANMAYDGDDIVVDGCTLTVDCVHTFNSLTVINGGVVTHSSVASCAQCRLDLAVLHDLFVDATSLVNVAGKGHGSQHGPGAGGSGHGGGGGAYGGDGGSGQGTSGGGGYGSVTEPMEPGSGGGRDNVYSKDGGAGGGAVRLTVGGTLTLDGTLTADGGDGSAQNPYGGGGGGSGGSIYLTAEMLTGSGGISANGGIGPNTGGGGGGGRIAIHYDTNSFTGTISACGGSSGSCAGGAGTIHTKGSAQSSGDLLIDNSGNSGSATPLSGVYTFDSVTVTHYGKWDVTDSQLSISQLSVADGGRVYLRMTTIVGEVEVANGGILYLQTTTIDGNVEVASGGVLWPLSGEMGFELTISGDLGVDVDGLISATGKGHGSQHGPGAGGSGHGGGGGAYGGDGGSGQGTGGGSVYGSVTEPMEPGSGGGRDNVYSKDGGAGGGAVRLTVGGTLTLDGTLTADGNDGSAYNPYGGGGGGSGGSIYLTAEMLTGSGGISANGGIGPNTGGGGGGGRIAIHYDTNSFTGTISACGGSSGSCAGGAGTIYTKGLAQSSGDLLIDNCGNSGSATPLSGVYTFDSVTVTHYSKWDVTDSQLTIPQLSVADGGRVYLRMTTIVGEVEVANGGILYLQTTTIDGNVEVASSGALWPLSGEMGFELTISGDLGVDVGGLVSAAGKGHGSQNGPGVGGSGHGGGGGAYGGDGGSGYGTGGGSVYGSVTEPMEPGSGGGWDNVYSKDGGAGGGAVRLTVGGTLTLDGTLTADGSDGSAYNPYGGGGGGSGGSIYLTAGTLTGSGGISANGGIGPNTGGGGGGGRIAIHYDTNTFTGTIFACGGSSGSCAGGAGTIYTKGSAQSSGDLLIDNCGDSSGVVTPLSGVYTFDSVTVTHYGKWDVTDSQLTISQLSVADGGRIYLRMTTIVGEVEVANGGILYLQQTATIDGNVEVASGGALWPLSGEMGFELTISGDLGVDVDGLISATGKGHGSQNGPGAGGSGHGGGGGAYGGDGGNGYGGGGGSVYGSVTEPMEPGSGGGRDNVYSKDGGAGGGAVRLTVDGTLTLDGTLTADGSDGSVYYPHGGGGGGSGGSIYLTAGMLTGSGGISANGGMGSVRGGGGGGGRIAIYYDTNTFTGTMSACGGSSGSCAGGAGTIYTKGSAQSSGDLLIDNCGNSGSATPLSGVYTFDSVTVTHYGKWDVTDSQLSISQLSVADGGRVYLRITTVVGEVEVANGGVLYLQTATIDGNVEVASGGALWPLSGEMGFELTILGDLGVDVGGLISATGKGHGSQNGPGVGGSGNYGGGGGAYGGDGGNGYGAGGGSVYGSVTEPMEPGSGGGWDIAYGRNGGAGGGAVRLTVGGTLTLDGTLTADGSNGNAYDPHGGGGGGSGGSIYLTAGMLTGSGGISANGGMGSTKGGGGGGGRTAIHYDTNTFTGTISACGGSSGYCAGGAGTIYTKGSAQSSGDLLIDNCGNSGAVTPLSGVYTFDNVTVTHYGKWDVPDSQLSISQLSVADGGRVYLRITTIVGEVEVANGGILYLQTATIDGNVEVASGGALWPLSGEMGFELTISGDLDVGGLISATSKGYGSQNGPGVGGSGNYGGGGGAYGGDGGNGYGAGGGGVYGSVTEPMEPGSGGGWDTAYGRNGGTGGGAVRLTVGGTLTLDGTLTANGSNGNAYDPHGGGGGGSGGSIYLTAGMLTGSGGISANGGMGSVKGGGGGGGRIAIYYEGISGFAVENIHVDGGYGYEYGEDGTIYLVLVDAPRVLSHIPDGVVNQPVDHVDLTFNVVIDEGTFTSDDVVLVDPGDVQVPITGSPVHLGGNVWRITFEAQTAEGEYHVYVGPHIEGPADDEMDQDLDGIGSEYPDDVYDAGFVIDMTPPEITDQTPSGEVNDPVDHIDITFSQKVTADACSNGDITLTGPNGEIPADALVEMSDNVWRLSFALQNTNGQYDLAVEPCFEDLAGNPMAAAYAGSFTIALPDLTVTQVTGPSEAGTGESIDIAWLVANLGTSDATGSWVDRVYLSDDDTVGDDIELGSFLQSGPLAPGDSYERAQAVVIPDDSSGNYWIVVVTDAGDVVAEAAAPANNAAVSGMLTITDTLEPNTTITSGPSEGATIDATSVTFEWSGEDNVTPAEELLFSYCLASVAIGCDPTSGPFGVETSALYDDLTEADSPYVFKVAARDLAGNVELSPAERTFSVDLTGPSVTGHTPEGVINEMVCAVEVTFNETVVDFDTGDVELIGSSGLITITGVEETDDPAVFVFRFACQSELGAYSFTVGPGIADLAGNSMAAAYTGGFTIALPDLAVTQVAPALLELVAGESLDVTWTVTNQGTSEAVGWWVDKIYLSEDDVVGGDLEIGSFVQSGPLASGGAYQRSESVTIPGALFGEHWIVVVTDVADAVVETGTPGNNSAVGDMLSIGDGLGPETTITSGPTNGTAINTGGVTFEWTGQDNATATEDLLFASCLAPMVTGCDPSGGPFGAETSASYSGLTELDSPYVFKVAARDQEGNVDLTPAQRTFSVDLTALTILGHSPDGVVNNAVCAVTVTFSEAVLGFGPGDVSLTGPSGAITVTQVVNTGSPETYQFRFACQSELGAYEFTVGTSMTDLAGNPLAESYTGGFTIALADLELTVCDSPDSADAGEAIEVSWTVANSGTSAASGSWVDKVYLSYDDAVGGDLHLGSFSQTGPLSADDAYSRIESVTIPGHLAGDYWIVVVVDANNSVVEPAGGEGNNAAVCRYIAVRDTESPETFMTAGPSDGATISASEVTFEWSGSDNATPVEQLLYAYCVGAACDPDAGPFSDATSFTFVDLSDGAVTFKVAARDLEENVDPTPVVRTFTVDLTGPEITGHTPSGVVNDSVCAIEVSFSEGVSGFGPEDVDLIGPSGTIAISAVAGVGGPLDYEIRFPCLLEEGEYSFTVGPNITDAGGNPMAEPYSGGFTIMLPDLMVSTIGVPDATLTEVEIEIAWTVTNAGSGTAAGNWQDCIYLSDDDQIGGDMLLECLEHPVDLAAGGSYQRTAMVMIPRVAEGDYWIIVVADTAGELTESVEGLVQNSLVSDEPIAITPAPHPDLQVTSFTPPPNAPTGSLVEVAWTVTNLGTAPAVGPWNEALFGSSDDTIGGDELGSVYRYGGVLNPGESVVRIETYQVPNMAPGGYWVVVCVDSADEIVELEEGNNCAIEDVCVGCLEPDLLITDIVGPPTAEAGASVGVEWAVLNNGNGAANGIWKDRVYLSSDAAVGDDLFLGEFEQMGPVAAGASYTGSGSVTLPFDLEGPYYFVVVTDATNAISEPGGETNNTLIDTTEMTVTQPDLPDLTVTQINVPAGGVLEDTVTVSWTVLNAGELSAEGVWVDRVYLSQDDAFSPDDIAMTPFAPISPVPAGGTYAGSADFALPGEPGSYWVIVWTDANDNVEEGTDEANNVVVSSTPINVVLPPRPDLRVFSVTASGTGVAGEPIMLNWMVHNDGDATAFGTWTDRVYLSTDGELGDDIFLGDFQQSGPVSPAGHYSRQEEVTVSLALEGDYYFIVVTDWYDDVDEGADAQSNVGTTAFATTIAQPDLPDLVPLSIDAPATGDTNEIVNVTWEVINNGELAADGAWKDRVFLSTDDVWNVGDNHMGVVDIEETVAVGASYIGGGEFRLPPQTGTYWFVVIANADHDLEEGADHGNNLLVAAVPITVGYPPRPDLEVTNIEVPGTEVPGTVIEITWTVSNSSAEAAAVGPWHEQIFVSPNWQIGNDTLVANVQVGETLAAGESIVRRREIGVPNMPGGYYVVVCVDVGSAVPETNESNNCSITPTAAQVIVADLAISDVTVPPTAEADSVAEVGWTVTNIGGAAARPPWVDAVYLSVGDEDVLLGTATRVTTLSPLGQYTASANVTIPGRLTGDYTFFVVADASGAVYESDEETNNIAYADTPTTIIQPDRPNLVVTNIVDPPDGLISQLQEISWTVRNVGGASAEGFWSDRIIAVSEDDGSEVALGQFFWSTPVAAGGSYVQTEEVAYPSQEGEYRLKVVTDYTDTVNEGVSGGEDDNAVTDDTTFTTSTYGVTVKTDLGGAVAGTAVPLHGQANLSGNGSPAPYAPVSVGVNVRGSLRTVSATTDANGDYDAVFNPLPTEAGRYRLMAGAPGDLDDAQQDVFVLWGMKAQPQDKQVEVYPGTPVSGQISLVNLGDVTLTGLEVVADGTPAWLNVQTALGGTTLLPLNSVVVYYTLSASGDQFGYTPITLNLTSAEGATADGNLHVIVRSPEIVLSVSPGSLAATMVRGGQTLVELEVTNIGATTATGLRVHMPETTWLNLGSPNLPDLGAGESATVLFNLLPDEEMALGPYSGSVVVGDEGLTYGVSVPFTFNLESDRRTDILVRVENEYTYWSTGAYSPDGPLVAGAVVQLLDAETKEVVAEGTATRAEAIEFHSVQEGFYDLRVVAPNHGPLQKLVSVEADGENEFSAFIPREPVRYTWTVEETEFEDITIMTLEALFETNVPIPVITVEPPVVDLGLLTEDVTQIDFTIKNHGLITADNVNFSFDSHPNWSFTPLVDEVGDLEAMGERVVPVMVERLGKRSAICNVGGHVGWALECEGTNYYATPIVIVNASYDCGGGGGGNSYTGGGGGSGGGPGGPFVSSPSMSPSENCECDPFTIEIDLSGLLKPAEMAIEGYILAQTSGWLSADASITAKGHLKLCCPEGDSCCTIPFPNGMELGAEVNASLALSPTKTNFSFNYEKDFTLLDVDLPEGITSNGQGDVTVSASLDFMAGLDVSLTPSISASVTKPCDGDICVKASASAAADASVGVSATAEAQVKYMGQSVGVASVRGVALLKAYADATYSYDSCGDGFSMTNCFQGVYAEVELGATLFPGTSVENTLTVVPCYRKFLISGVGDCPPLSECDGDRGETLPSVELDLDLERFLSREAVRAEIFRQVPKRVHRYHMREAGYGGRGGDDEGICAKVRIQLEQEAMITRTGFTARFQIENPDDYLEVEDLFVSFSIYDADGELANDLFAVSLPTLVGLTGVDGTGVVGINSVGEVSWLIVARSEAAPTEDTTYHVSGVFSYTRGPHGATIPLEPVPIVVKPDASLIVKYFWQRDVFSDDPFTAEIEPAEPFSLGMSMTNQGYGYARNVRVASGQPQIIENERGLLIAFELIGTQVGTEEFTPSLNVNLGDIAPSQTAVARWLMTSSLQGQFTEYSAEYEHVNPLGDPTLSVIDSVDIFELIHVVRGEHPTDDLLMDFMTNEIAYPDDPYEAPNDWNRKDLPDTVHLSNGQTETVTPVLDADVTPLTSSGQQGVYQAHVNVITPDGWVYLKMPDPSQGEYRLSRVERSDGSELVLEYNTWQTDRTFREGDEQPLRQYRVHLFDRGGSRGGYTLFFASRDGECEPGPGKPDCNSNGIADVCDIAAGTSPDCNSNAVPDECETVTNAELSLNVAAGSECVTTTGLVTVTLDVANLPVAINGVQALIHYDTTHLALTGITPATGWSLISPPNPNDPDPDGDGDVTCALYVPGGSVSTNGTVATLVFEPAAEGTTNVTFQADNDPFFTKLTVAADSSTILPDKQESGTISIDNTVAVADSNSPVCEGGTIELHGGPSDGPDEPYTYSWIGPDDFASSDQNPTISDATLDMDGTYTLTVSNASGCQFTAQTDVEVQLCLTVNVEVEGLIGNGGVYGPPSAGAELVRDVTFVLTDCDDAADTQVIPVTFTADTDNNKGVGSVTFTGLDAGLDWLSVQEGHTLRKLVEVDFVTTLADSVTVFLSSGDFHTAIVGQDNLVDITDFSILASSWETIIDADESVGGDATGDGYHDADDFALIQPNFFQTGEGIDGCSRVGRVPPATVAPASPPVADIVSRTPRASIELSELRLTVAYAERADLDGNGVVDVRDIRAFAERHDLPLSPEFEARLTELEASLPELETMLAPETEADPGLAR